jgi:ABC transport system ATP-binding/permease protein
MALISLRSVELGVGGAFPLLDGVDLDVDAGERICIVGRNGAGKSTLLRLLAGEIKADDGSIQIDPRTVVSRLAQEIPQDVNGSVFDVVAAPLGEIGGLLAEYHVALERVNEPEHAERAATLQTRIDALRGWDVERRVEEVVTRLSLPGNMQFAALSGGLKRRVLLAQALVSRPDVLLLDEPTNHLDIDAIAWLETLLAGFGGSIVFVTHDRRFLRALATRIVEIDRGSLTSWPGDYDNYLRRRAERLHAEAQQQARFDRKLADEEVWIRQGIKARRTRNEGRVRALESLRRERAARRDQQGDAQLRVAAAARSGRRVIEAEDVSFSWGPRPIVSDFSTTILRGDRVGLVGPNGAGKTTLLQLLLGELMPDHGAIKRGTNLEIAYFDQQRAQLDESASVADNVVQGREFLDIDGGRTHVISFLQDFLFTPAQARGPITRLSGGERNRLLLARLFARPSNLLVMDEPTNDLDVETLELLEERLAEYAGTLLLVTHDREFLDNVVTSLLIADGSGRIEEWVGGYSDWATGQRARTAAATDNAQSAPAPPRPQTPRSGHKLSYKDQRELDTLPGRIETLEEEISALTTQLGDPALHRDHQALARVNAALSAAQVQLDAAYTRWAELDEAGS